MQKKKKTVGKYIGLSFKANFSFFSLAKSPPRDLQITAYKIIMVCSCAMLSNCVWLQTIFCTCVKETVLFSFLQSLLLKMADRFASRGYSLNRQTRWSNDKTIIELSYCKISWFASVSHVNYLPLPSASANNWSACHRQITIFCSTLSNNC